MTEINDIDETEINEDVKPAQTDERANVLAALKLKTEDAAATVAGDKKLPRPIGVFGADVVALYKYVPIAQIQAQSAKLQNAPERLRNYYGACDVLTLACEEIKIRMEDGRLVPLALPGEEPVTFKDFKRLAQHLGFEAEAAAPGYTSRSAILKMFQSEYAVVLEAQRVSQFMATLKTTAEEDFLLA